MPMPANSDGQVKKQMIILNYDLEVELGQCGTFTLNDSGSGLTPVKHLKMKTECTQQYGRTSIVRYANKPYPYIFEYKGKRWFLHTPYRPDDDFQTPYIILESLKNNRNSARVVHTLTSTYQQSEYNLGRGHEADVRVINDISVSRKHMNISYKNGNFVLTDLKSKFGTLVLVKGDLSIKSNEQKAIQVGRSVMNFAQKEESDENIDLPLQDRIQNPVREFLAHKNQPVMKGIPLPRNEYLPLNDQ
jgi:hypothetical protein